MRARGHAERVGTLHLLALPVETFLAAQAHYDAIFREFALIEMGSRRQAPARAGVPRDVVRRVEAIRRLRGPAREALERQIRDALREGRRTIDVELPFPRQAVDVTEEQARLQDELDEHCRAGTLMTLASPPAVVAFRRHWTEEVGRQLRDHLRPRPFPPA